MSTLGPLLDPTRLLIGAGLTPDPWQEELLLSPWQRALLNVTRQGGKSTAAAALGLHQALVPGSLVLVLSPTQRQSKELFGKLWGLYQDAGRPVAVENKSAMRASFANGSRVVSLPGTEKTVRGYSGVDLLLVDEAARVLDGLYRTVRPMLAVSGGRLVALSTPWGRRGWYWKAWSGSEDWHRVRVTAHDCPRITEEFLQQERREMPDLWFRSEYLCAFTDTVDAAFATADIDRMTSPDVPPLFGAEEAFDVPEDETIPTL